jgi:hypothetical protein
MAVAVLRTPAELKSRLESGRAEIGPLEAGNPSRDRQGAGMDAPR